MKCSSGSTHPAPPGVSRCLRDPRLHLRDAVAPHRSIRADYDVAEKTFRDPDDFGKEYWGSWARLVLTRKEADRRELLERISEDAVLG